MLLGQVVGAFEQMPVKSVSHCFGPVSEGLLPCLGNTPVERGSNFMEPITRSLIKG